MSERLQFLLLALGFCAILFIALKWGFIGTRGGGVSRSESAAVFWLAVGGAVFALVLSLGAGFGLF